MCGYVGMWVCGYVWSASPPLLWTQWVGEPDLALCGRRWIMEDNERLQQMQLQPRLNRVKSPKLWPEIFLYGCHCTAAFTPTHDPFIHPLTKVLSCILFMRQRGRMQAGRMEGPVCVVQFKEELFASCCKCIIYFINKKTNHNHKYLNSSKSSTCGGQYHDMWEKIPLHVEMHRRQF